MTSRESRMMLQDTLQPAPAARSKRRDIITQLVGANRVLARASLRFLRKFAIASRSDLEVQPADRFFRNCSKLTKSHKFTEQSR
jgi:hypothetical protein